MENIVYNRKKNKTDIQQQILQQQTLPQQILNNGHQQQTLQQQIYNSRHTTADTTTTDTTTTDTTIAQVNTDKYTNEYEFVLKLNVDNTENKYLDLYKYSYTINDNIVTYDKILNNCSENKLIC